MKTFYDWLMEKYPKVNYKVKIKKITPAVLAGDLKFSYKQFQELDFNNPNVLTENVYRKYVNPDYTLYDYFFHFVNNKASNETLETFVKLWNEYRNEVKE